LKGSSAVPVRTEKYSKWRGTYVEIPNGWDRQNYRDREKGDTLCHLPHVGHDHRDDQRAQSQYPIDREHGQRERPCPGRVSDLDMHCVGFDIHCNWPVLSIIGKLVPARYSFGCCGEISWSGVTNCEDCNWYGLVRGRLDGKNEGREIVFVKWCHVLAIRCSPVFHIKGRRIQEAEGKERCVNPSDLNSSKILQ